MNNQINENVTLTAKIQLVYMEHRGILDRTNPHHIGAIQALMCGPVQHALDQLRRLWDIHPVRSRKRTKGVPRDLRAARPHPGGQVRFPHTVDWPAEYERANGTQLRRAPTWTAQRDALHYQPARQAARTRAIHMLWGSDAHVWNDIQHNTGRTRFIPCFRLFVTFR